MSIGFNIFKFWFDIVFCTFGVIALPWFIIKEIRTKESLKWAQGSILKKIIAYITYVLLGLITIIAIPYYIKTVKVYGSDIPYLIKGQYLHTEGYPSDIYDEGGKFSDDIIVINGLEVKAAGGIPRKYMMNYKFIIDYLPKTMKAIKIEVIKDE